MKKKIKITTKHQAGYCLSEEALIHLHKMKMALGVSMSAIVELCILNAEIEKLKAQYIDKVKGRMKNVIDVVEVSKDVRILTAKVKKKNKVSSIYYNKRK